MNWQQQILNLREQYYQKKYPNICRDHGVTKENPYNDSSIAGLIKAIVDYITFSGGQAHETTKIHVRKIKGNTRWATSPSRLADFDILAVFKNQKMHIRIERKNDFYRSFTETHGMLNCTVKNMSEFVSWWKESALKLQRSIN